MSKSKAKALPRPQLPPTPRPRRAAYLYTRSPYGAFWLTAAVAAGLAVALQLYSDASHETVSNVLFGLFLVTCVPLWVYLMEVMRLRMRGHETSTRTVRPAVQRVVQQPVVSSHADLLASDADRADCRAVLFHAQAEGRLTFDEFDERLERSFNVRTYGQLAELTNGLPYHRVSELPRVRTIRGLIGYEWLTLLLVFPLLGAMYWYMSTLPLGGNSLYVLSVVLVCGTSLGRMTVRRR